MAVSKSPASTMKEVQCNYKWVTASLIHQFSSKADGVRKLNWKIAPKLAKYSDDQFFFVLELLTDIDDEISVNYSCNIEEYGTGRVLFEDVGTCKFEKGVKTGWNKLIPKQLGLRPAGNLLKFTYDFSYIDGNCDQKKVVASCGAENFRDDKSVTELIENFGQLLLEPKFSDVTLCVKDKEFKAHKNILSARSPVFAAMFQHDTKENQENKVEIQDLEPEIVQEMLNFIYTGSAPNLNKMAEELLEAADRYELKSLMRMIADEHLISTLSSENVMKLLVLADMHSATKLYNAAIKFVAANAKELEKIGK